MTTTAVGVTRIVGALGLFVTAVAILHGQSAERGAAGTPEVNLARLASELDQLKVQVLQVRIELEQGRIDSRERELREVEENLRSLSAQQDRVNEEVDDMQRQLLDASLAPDQRASIASTASEASTTVLTSINDERAAVEHQQAMLQAQLSQSYRARSQLQAQAIALGVSGPGNTVR